ncbi:uncharacterized protein EAF02_006727 [Botrytis sinoallii]|uniref:uncharacterized protein n=1 Tax=Botrytis sinoallii TaxID=1463999 RepID=UPI0019012593|nr:uncharacterized protein EAF02_006727 [Botrytis sinoallii]KAF7880836.1 hypothetical protein EAF02_006727 [Botrytis sinoallii]
MRELDAVTQPLFKLLSLVVDEGLALIEPIVSQHSSERPNRRTQTETPLERELQGLENETTAVKSSNGHAADDNSSPSTLAYTDEMRIEAPSSENILEQLPPAKLATPSISIQAVFIDDGVVSRIRPKKAIAATQAVPAAEPKKYKIQIPGPKKANASAQTISVAKVKVEENESDADDAAAGVFLARISSYKPTRLRFTLVSRQSWFEDKRGDGMEME